MVFNSAQFLLFLPLAALGYFAVPQKARRGWLLLACYFFYFCWNPAHVPVLLFVTAVGYLGGRLLNGKPNKGVLAVSIILALAPLIGLKYLGFLTHSVLAVLAHLGVQIAPPALDFLLPMGISFYTLQVIGYLVDTYRGAPAEESVLDFALFASFFPQMVSGPISRGKSLLPQLSAAKRPTFDDLRDGVLLLIWGYFLKIVVADRAALFVAAVYAPDSEYEGWFYIIATLLFCLQLYCEFGGCSVMAMGTAKILGIDLIDNFNAPYFSQSIAEFLAAVAYLAVHLVPGLSLHPPGRQPQRYPAQVRQCAHHLCSQRSVARRPVELHGLGPAERFVSGPWRGTAAGAQGRGESAACQHQLPPPQAAAGSSHLCAVCPVDGLLPCLPLHGRGAHPAQHVHRP